MSISQISQRPGLEIRRRTFRSLLLATALTMAGVLNQASAQTTDTLAEGFQTPPAAAKPFVWWHWLSGNVSKEGITADLEWMKRAGIGGFQMFDVGMSTPQFIEKPVRFMTPEWKGMVRHAAQESHRLGLEMGMAMSSGWSESGGTWVTPRQAMKKLVWSETMLQGPRHFSGLLPRPPSASGPYQNLALEERSSKEIITDAPGAISLAPPPVWKSPTYYVDDAVIAYRVPKAETDLAALSPVIRASASAVDLRAATDGDITTNISIPVDESSKSAWLEIDFGRPVTVSAVSLALIGETFFTTIMASADGRNFTPVLSKPPRNKTLDREPDKPPLETFAFSATTARVWRIALAVPNYADDLDATEFEKLRRDEQPTHVEISEVAIHADARVHRGMAKAAFGIILDADRATTPAVDAKTAITEKDVIDLTGRVTADGHLDWNVPPGTWRILRLGSSLTGRTNVPASPGAEGLEVDKLDSDHVHDFLKTYVDQIAEATGPEFGRGLTHFLLDSWEAGLQNWTDKLREEFKAKRGYDPTPYLPVLTGRVVTSADVSDRFLWDFRRTLAELLAENHYGKITADLHARGIRLYAEAAGIGTPIFQDALQNKGLVDVPMGEFWTLLPGQETSPGDNIADIREAVSAAHIYGKPVVAAESFTAWPESAAWTFFPSNMKPLADRNMAMGLNKFIIHTSVHQPFLDRAPGLTLWHFGQQFTRNNIWAEQASAFVTYLSRSSFMLQQGRPVSDIAYFYGEGAPLQALPSDFDNLKMPTGYAFDYVNAEVLLNRLHVVDNRLTLPEGGGYRLLVLPPHLQRMTPALLRRLRDLVADGAVILGPKPQLSPSLENYPRADREVVAIADELWGRDAPSGKNVTRFGRGRVYAGWSVGDVLADIAATPDFEFSETGKVELPTIHRSLADGDIYFVTNPADHRLETVGSFRVSGREAELWHADTGAIEPASYKIVGDRTMVPLTLDQDEAVFVVFRKPASASERVLPVRMTVPVANISDDWQVDFPPQQGGTATLKMPALSSWSENSNSIVRYFSGTATYRKTINAPKSWFRQGASLKLDLGNVANIAEVSVNNKPLGILWKAPYRIDLANLLKPGRNNIEIKVTNGWINRMIGDKQPGAKSYSWSTYNPYKENSPLPPSGLLGPIQILSENQK